MLNQLIRQEAMDAYADRWLGEVSASWAVSTVPLALIGSGAIIFLAAILIFGFYTRQTTLQGVIGHARTPMLHEEITFVAFRKPDLRIGQELSLDIRTGNPAGERSHARIASLTSTPVSGGSLYRIGLMIPSTLHIADGDRFQVHVPIERRQLYQWMFLCSPN